MISKTHIYKSFHENIASLSLHANKYVKALKNIHVIALDEVHRHTDKALDFSGQNGFGAIYSRPLVKGIVAGPTNSHGGSV